MSTFVNEPAVYHRFGAPQGRQDLRDSGWLLVELLRVIRSAASRGDRANASAKSAPLLAELLTAYGRPWPALQVPERLMISATIRNDSVEIHVEGTDEFESILAVRFDYGGRLLTWKSWSDPRPRRAELGQH